MICRWVPVLNAIIAPQMPMLVSAEAVGAPSLVAGIPSAVVSQLVVFKRSNRQFGAPNGEAPAQPSQDSAAADWRIANEANRQERDRFDDHWIEGVEQIARFRIPPTYETMFARNRGFARLCIDEEMWLTGHSTRV
jgi:hypothetical protein